jgi:hypothetical protein
MPKKPIDYSNTIVYMLCCKDPTITDVYVGHTTNLSKRKAHHKAVCNNPNNKEYNMYKYSFIRENGGWDNWEMIVLETKSCIDGDDARKLEREWFEKKGATLNKQLPIIGKEEKIEQNKIYCKTYNQEHPELKEYKKIYNQEHHEELKEYKKIYNQEHHEEILEKKKIYYQEHRGEIKEKNKIYYQKKKLQNNTDVKLVDL